VSKLWDNLNFLVN